MAIARDRVPAHLHERYGIKPKSRWRWVLAAGAAGAAVGLFIWIGLGLGSGDDTRLIQWEAQGETVTIKWSAVRFDNAPVVCVLRAMDKDRFDVGFAITKVAAPAFEPQRLSTLRVRGDVYAVDNPSCETDPANLPSPHFRPGFLPPSQDLPLAAPWQPLD